ncbi:MurR/RpiR family transcriptional regulator [Polycladidibacter hongkongensis]|uniref:MurR/RpiR family transcriptional regulator n=1 Tax=Polycladidibacter hongkongensis TaxID=1647556 RepID=UPI000829C1E5|nr:MurR/RpiR family transcriptional regulator [Pseudovibrio hongkongensis]
MKDIFAVLKKVETELSKSEQAIAKLLYDHAEFAVSASITELAQRANVSAPTVTRFCRRLGCDSYSDFKVQLASAVFAGERFLRSESKSIAPDDIADDLFSKARAAMNLAREQLDLNILDEAARAIASAGTVAAFGSGGASNWVTEEMRLRLFRLGIKAVAVHDHILQVMHAATLDMNDVLIVSSFSGGNTELIRAMEAARDYGATIIAFTRPSRPVARAADLVIGIDLEEGTNILRPTSARYAYLLTLDILATRVAMLKEDSAREVLRRIKLQLVNRRGSDDKEPLGD